MDLPLIEGWLWTSLLRVISFSRKPLSSIIKIIRNQRLSEFCSMSHHKKDSIVGNYVGFIGFSHEQLIGDILGKGASGRVYSATDKDSLKNVALKEMNKKLIGKEGLPRIKVSCFMSIRRECISNHFYSSTHFEWYLR